MYLLKKTFNTDFFTVQEVQPEDVDTWLQNGVSLFSSEIHASYANTLLGIIAAPDWVPNYRQYGSILSLDYPFFRANDEATFNHAWLKIMASEARLRAIQKLTFVDDLFFSVSTLVAPPPAPWACLVDHQRQTVIVVDRTGQVFGGSEQSILNTLKHRYSFERELLFRNNRHLEMIEVNLGLKKRL